MALEDFVVRNMRIEALKIAVKTFDPDREVHPLQLLTVAQTIFEYLVDGKYPQPVWKSEQEKAVDVGPIEDFEAVNRMELGLKDMPGYGTGKTEVSTVESRQHPEQQDDEPEVL